MKLRDDVAKDQRFSIEVKAHLRGRAELCLEPYGVACPPATPDCRANALFTGEQFASHDHQGNRRVEVEPVVLKDIEQVAGKQEMLALVRASKRTGRKNMVGGSVMVA